MQLPADFFDTTVLIILAIMLLLAFTYLLYRMSNNINLLRSRKRDQIKRVNDLKLKRMLEYLNIPFSRYIHNTSELDRERHIWACQNCPNPQECKQLLNGEKVEMEIEEICPNNNRIKDLSKNPAE